ACLLWFEWRILCLRRDIIVWMDHRALDQAERINSHSSPVLQFYGGSVSPEMQAPKLLWVKENLQESWSMACRWMDLSDWLAYRATGDDTRSLCTTVCKWTYLGHAHMGQWRELDSRDMEACGWDEVFWEEIGLGDLVEGNRAKIGRSVAFPGHALGSGLTPTSAKELGLLPGTPVGTSLIDAHAGGVGVMESVPEAESKADLSDEEAICRRMVLVCGTSTCHMAVSKNKLFIPGVWGPFWSAMIPEYWLTEGGQSATGALLDYIVENHAAAPLLANHAASQSVSIFELLNKILLSMAHEQNIPFLSALSQDTHVLPDFHGNRSPVADPKSKGVICGLTLDTSEKYLALLYLATIQGIAYGTRHIVEHCNAHGHKIDTLLACGGLAKNSLYIQEHADIIGCPIILPRENESVLLGASVLGAVAAKKFSGIHDAMKSMNAAGKVVHPSSDPRVKKYHDAKYKIFRSLYEQQLSHRSTMAQALQ
uniref:Carbohydrate kinase FGGY C-terminal domain-containing protein n=1 Tax=Aegilops tauschii subsp. strangulata TaxID=200361 RepID=A0A453NIL2_AEGTS